MSLKRPRTLYVLAVTIVALVVFAPAFAQTACLSPNCDLTGPAKACLNRAAPRTPTVMVGSGGNVFVPSHPRIEPGECIIWMSASITTHSSTGEACNTATTCSQLQSPTCKWDSANLSTGSIPMRTCFYDPASFPITDDLVNPPTPDPYHCRIHALMTGMLHVTTPIILSVNKDLGTNSVSLTWSGGGVTGDVSYKVELQNGGDPKFPAASTSTVDPDLPDGVSGTTYTEALAGTTHYYLVRNKQSNQ